MEQLITSHFIRIYCLQRYLFWSAKLKGSTICCHEASIAQSVACLTADPGVTKFDPQLHHSPFHCFKKGSYLAKKKKAGLPLRGPNLPRKSVNRLIDRRDMTLQCWLGYKTTNLFAGFGTGGTGLFGGTSNLTTTQSGLTFGTTTPAVGTAQPQLNLSAATDQPFQLNKPPVGAKRGKR